MNLSLAFFPSSNRTKEKEREYAARDVIRTMACANAFAIPARITRASMCPRPEVLRLAASSPGTLPVRGFSGARAVACGSSTPSTITITKPDDWHLHLRDGDGLASVVPHSAMHFQRSVIMPNLVPPVTTPAMAMAYKARIEAAVPQSAKGSFTPLMTMYLTDNTTPGDVQEAKAQGVVAFKLYPAGATTNSDSGVTDWKKCVQTLKAMEEVRG